MDPPFPRCRRDPGTRATGPVDAPGPCPSEVVCHGDLAPYSCVVEGDRPVGFIDFDTVHPAPRLWDLAHAVHRFAPLRAPSNPHGTGTPCEQARRAAHLRREYGTVPGPLLLDTVVDRLGALPDHMRERAAEGDADWSVSRQLPPAASRCPGGTRRRSRRPP